MKRSDVSFGPMSVSEDIELDFEGYYDSGWWKDFSHNYYCYACDDNDDNLGEYQISLYYKNDKVGFLTFNLDVNQKSAECDYDPWVFYIEIVEIGLQIEYSNLFKYLFDYLFQ